MLFLLVGSLAGCATTASAPTPRNLTLLVPLSVPEDRARVFLQEGQVVDRLDEFTPHCAIEIDRVSGLPRTVPAGIYAVRRVQGLSTSVVLGGPGRQLAGVSIGVGVGFGHIGLGLGRGFSLEEVFEGYHFWLADGARVGLMRLTCLGARAEPAEVMPPSRTDIARALGKLGRLE